MIFGNPVRIVSDRGSAFTLEKFKRYCDDENIIHHTNTTGLPKANGHIEIHNTVIIAVLSKLSIDDLSKWYKHVSKVQQIINSTYSRSTKTKPFNKIKRDNQQRNN